MAIPVSTCTDQTGVRQVRRLLGPEYAIVCEARNDFECIAVSVDAGEILGCDSGGSCETDRMDRQREGCRWNVAIVDATVSVKGQVFDVVNAHPERRTAECRLASMWQIFEDAGQPGSLVQEERALLLGDFNMDPWRKDDVIARYWRTRVSSAAGSDYAYHSGIAESGADAQLKWPDLSRPPDGLWLAFVSCIDGELVLCVMDADGKELSQVEQQPKLAIVASVRRTARTMERSNRTGVTAKMEGSIARKTGGF